VFSDRRGLGDRRQRAGLDELIELVERVPVAGRVVPRVDGEHRLPRHDISLPAVAFRRPRGGEWRGLPRLDEAPAIGRRDPNEE
jgi:hypothetical protein